MNKYFKYLTLLNFIIYLTYICFYFYTLNRDQFDKYQILLVILFIFLNMLLLVNVLIYINCYHWDRRSTICVKCNGDGIFTCNMCLGKGVMLNEQCFYCKGCGTLQCTYCNQMI